MSALGDDANITLSYVANTEAFQNIYQLKSCDIPLSLYANSPQSVPSYQESSGLPEFLYAVIPAVALSLVAIGGCLAHHGCRNKAKSLFGQERNDLQDSMLHNSVMQYGTVGHNYAQDELQDV